MARGGETTDVADLHRQAQAQHGANAGDGAEPLGGGKVRGSHFHLMLETVGLLLDQGKELSQRGEHLPGVSLQRYRIQPGSSPRGEQISVRTLVAMAGQ
jgi:hypothetical protein